MIRSVSMRVVNVVSISVDTSVSKAVAMGVVVIDTSMVDVAVEISTSVDVAMMSVSVLYMDAVIVSTSVLKARDVLKTLWT